MIRASICISTYDRPRMLRQTLKSIYKQRVPFEFETIVVDDGSPTAVVQQVCQEFPRATYLKIDREPGMRNPCVPRNTAYRAAQGEVVIAQSDEVVHVTPDTIRLLVEELVPGHFIIANVFALSPLGKVWSEYTGPKRQKPFFFLGSVYRKDLYAVGGNDEEFRAGPAYDDEWFACCIMNGLRLRPVYSPRIIGHHQYHPAVSNLVLEENNEKLFQSKYSAAVRTGSWCSSGGSWPFHDDSSQAIEEKFTTIYRSRGFYDGGAGGSDESASGAGSSLVATRIIREAIPKVLEEYNVKTLLDIPCGDFNWMAAVDLSGVSYVGADVIEELVSRNQDRYGRLGRRFEHLDLLDPNLPKADLALCRDCLQHMSHHDVWQAIANLRRSGIQYLLATTFPNHHENRPIETGQWYPHNLQEPPFNFIPPLEIINEGCREHFPNFADKSLALWNLEDMEPWRPKSIVVCVDFDDLLSITLPRNKRHFEKVVVITTKEDKRTQYVAAVHHCECLITDAFTRHGATFNKGLAIEEGLSYAGRTGWLCIWDCDIVLPEIASMTNLSKDCLYGAQRRILQDPREFRDGVDWSALPCPTKSWECAGYFQLFYTPSPSLIEWPWYGTRWKHAGGGDSDFQLRYPRDKWKHVPFDVLHLGPEGTADLDTRIGQNWLGRVTPRIDTGKAPAEANHRKEEIRRMVLNRQLHGTSEEVLM